MKKGKKIIDHGAGRKNVWENRLRTEMLTPVQMQLYEGEELHLWKPGTREEGGQRVKVKILKLYRHHALCLCRGRRECFTYAEIASSAERAEGMHARG